MTWSIKPMDVGLMQAYRFCRVKKGEVKGNYFSGASRAVEECIYR